MPPVTRHLQLSRVGSGAVLGRVIVLIMLLLESIAPVQKSIYLLPRSLWQNTHGQAIQRNEDNHKKRYYDGSVISRWKCRTNKSVKSNKRRNGHHKYDQICDKSNHGVLKWPNDQKLSRAAGDFRQPETRSGTCVRPPLPAQDGRPQGPLVPALCQASFCWCWFYEIQLPVFLTN
jgi:hypothetical protein